MLYYITLYYITFDSIILQNINEYQKYIDTTRKKSQKSTEKKKIKKRHERK